MRIEPEDSEMLGRMLDSWLAYFGSAEITAGDAVRLLEGYPVDRPPRAMGDDCARRQACLAIRAALLYSREVSARTLGIYFAQHEGQQTGKLKVVRAGTYKRAVVWRVDQCP